MHAMDLEDAPVKNPRDNQPLFPVRDYSSAVQNAVSWLGDRYLLATPISAHSPDWRPARRSHLAIKGARFAA
jgi:hypothetical protein